MAAEHRGVPGPGRRRTHSKEHRTPLRVCLSEDVKIPIAFLAGYTSSAAPSTRTAVRFVLRSEQPVTCDDSEPEPNISVVKGAEADFWDDHPHTAELVIEVCLAATNMTVRNCEHMHLQE